MEKLDGENNNNRNNKDYKINKVINNYNNNNFSNFLSGRKYNESIKINNNNNILTYYNIQNNDLNQNIKTTNYNQIDKNNKTEIDNLSVLDNYDAIINQKIESLPSSKSDNVLTILIGFHEKYSKKVRT